MRIFSSIDAGCILKFRFRGLNFLFVEQRTYKCIYNDQNFRHNTHTCVSKHIALPCGVENLNL